MINKESILVKVLAAKKTRAAAFAAANQRVEMAKKALLNEFDNHPITVELLAGPDLEDSKVMPMGYGNLFSFLGFNRNTKENPIHPIRRLLENIHLIRAPSRDKTHLVFTVRAPSNDDIEKKSPMTWESGRSWVHAVTYGIGTFSHYMFSLKEGRFSRSKSGTAIQTKTNLRNTSTYFLGRGYVIGMLGKFNRRLSS